MGKFDVGREEFNREKARPRFDSIPFVLVEKFDKKNVPAPRRERECQSDVLRIATLTEIAKTCGGLSVL